MQAEAATSEFTLDTSGVVDGPINTPDGQRYDGIGWGFLDPFTQGYVEALFASAAEARWPEVASLYGTERVLECWKPAFSDLSPEALAAILADCAGHRDFFKGGGHREPTREDGRTFWELRQLGQLPGDPPLAVSVGDAGKIHLTNTPA